MRALVWRGAERVRQRDSGIGGGLRDRDLEVRLAGTAGLGPSPSGKQGRKFWHGGRKRIGLCGVPLQSALIHSCAGVRSCFIPYVQQRKGPMRELLGRVLGEVATPSMGLDLLQFIGDGAKNYEPRPPVAMSHANPPGIDALNENGARTQFGLCGCARTCGLAICDARDSDCRVAS